MLLDLLVLICLLRIQNFKCDAIAKDRSDLVKITIILVCLILLSNKHRTMRIITRKCRLCSNATRRNQLCKQLAN